MGARRRRSRFAIGCMGHVSERAPDQPMISIECSMHQSRNACSVASKACQRSTAPRRASRALNFGQALRLLRIVRQKFAGEVEHQRLAQAQLALVRERDVFLLLVDVVRELVVELCCDHKKL